MSDTVTAGASAPATSSAPSGGASTQPSQASSGLTVPSNAQGGGSTAETKTTEPSQPTRKYFEGADKETFVKLKVDGQEQEFTVEELKRAKSLETAARKRMTETAKIEKEYQKLQAQFQALQENPNQALEQLLGGKFDSLAEERLARKYELEQMDPVQRENLELRQKIEAQQKLEMESKRSVIDEIKKLSDQPPANLEKYSKEDLANYRDHLQNVHTQAQGSLEKELLEAWTETGLPKDKRWGIMIAREMMMSQNSETGPLQAKDAAAKVKSDWLNFTGQILAQMDAPAIQEMLGQAVVNKLREYDIQKATGQAPGGLKPQEPIQAPQKEKRYLTQMEYRREMGIA